ncbi:DUF4153 domain-containing protein [Flavobacterium foetidum]|uniref:DUF4153 domain-containing protein n=1 Tax=Flavobacterium foetidum TaxID=2026681 RepID=UPI00107527CF|nr:DUF4173 domain-containing protein [Flavobacterium foetidum]KAF2514187.1 DUF4173 domain-containing protein [Flavobacterium foetidum]
MKKHQIILVSSLVFALLFYKEALGVNLGIFGIFLTAMICFLYQDRFVSRTHLILVITSVLSSIAFAWYGDFPSFLALALSVLFLQFKTQHNEIKILQIFPLIFLNGIASLGRIFIFSQWLPKKEVKNDTLKKFIAYLFIPTLFLVLFFTVYSFGSDHFSSLFKDYTLDIDLPVLFLISMVGFYISFSFWNYWVPEISFQYNSKLNNDFDSSVKNNHKNTFSFLDLDFERRSGEITLLLLNAMLLVFIATYNYEQFFESSEISKLSADTHERVNAVIFSIIMAVGVILFYFKSGFNFDEKAARLKNLSKIWIALNIVLIISALLKNAEYVSFFGLTYKRLGVFAFLILAVIGLVLTFYKIVKQKTNAFLFNKMVWFFYGTILLCSYINWGNLITTYNIAVNKGVEPYFLFELNFNDEQRATYFRTLKNETITKQYHNENSILSHKNDSFLSKALYYEFVDTQTK